MAHRRASEAAGFYSSESAARLARISLRTLNSWRRKGLVEPTVRLESDEETEFGYSFVDVVYLRIVKVFRDHRVTLTASARAVAEHLIARFGPPGPRWREARIYLLPAAGMREIIVANEDEWQRTVATRSGQRVSPILYDAMLEMDTRPDALLVPAEFKKHVTIDPRAKSGMPLIRDTGITTSAVYEVYKRSIDETRISDSFPDLTPAQISSAIRFESMLDAA